MQSFFMIDIYSLTQKQYADAIFTELDKGKELAKLVYSLWFKEGRHPLENEILPTAKKLLQKILEITDFSIPSTFEQKGSKWLQTFSDRLQTESVEIQMEFGFTLCLSSQVGCRMGCAFCETGRLGLIRNLSVKEIVLQLYYAKVIRKVAVRNLVFMGMGEPFDNYEAVKQAIAIFTDSCGFGLGPSRITVSTSGLVDILKKFTQEVDPRVKLAVSINGSSDLVRSKVMPVNSRFSMGVLKESLMEYQKSHPKRTLLFEYVLLENITDLLSMADDLAKFCEGFIDLRINVIPYNPQSRARFKTPSIESTQNFMDRLRSHGYRVYLRGTKGEKEMAACGQLGNLGLRSIKINSIVT
ncbi:MAG: radical SAM protein [Chlamydiae bacterium]|nr:radical SAM protein [Chlamydiota bacterium]